MFFDETSTHQTPPSSPLPSPQWLYSPRSLSYSPPASRSPWESSVEPHSEDSSPTGRKRHKSKPAFIRPRDVNRGLTPGLSALMQEMSPLAPYKWERSAKARARQAFNTMHWTPFNTLLRKSVILVQIDSFEDLCDLSSKLTHFKTRCSYTALNCSNWLLSKTPALSMGNYLQTDNVKSPWETFFNKIGYVMTILHSESWTHFKTLASFWQCFNYPWETSLNKLILSGPSYTINLRFLSRPLWLICHMQWTDSFQDHSEEEKNREHTAGQF